MGGFFGGGSTLVGATSSVTGLSGLVPAPTPDDINSHLAGDGTFHVNLFDQAQATDAYDATYNYYQPYMLSRSGRDGALASGTIYLTPFRVPQQISVSFIVLHGNQVASAAGTTAKFAIYKWATQYNRPRCTTLVSSAFSTIDMTVTGALLSTASSPVTLTRGLYFVATAASGTTGTISRFRDDLFHAQFLCTMPWGNRWPINSFPCTPSFSMSTVGTTYATLWPTSLSTSSTNYNIQSIDAGTPIVFLIAT